MTFTIDIELLRGVFEGGGSTAENAPEWPPHPARLFNGLVATAETQPELDALRWLESQPPPDIKASEEHTVCGGHASYVPTNQIQSNGAYGRFVNRKALGPRTWRAVSPASQRVSYVWPNQPDVSIGEQLRGLVLRLPYLGRSTSPVVAQTRAETEPDVADGRSRFCAVEDGPGLAVRLPQTGYLDALTEAFNEGRQPWEVPQRVATYRSSTNWLPVRPMVVPSPYSEMIVLGFRDGRRFGVGQLMALTSRLREAIQAHVDGGPVVLRGQRPRHELGNDTEEAVPRHQVAFAGLPFVGAEHASGLLLGLGVILPTDISIEDRRIILRGLAQVVDGRLLLGRQGGVVRLDPAVQPQRTLRASTWTGPSMEWVTAIPMSANRHHRRLDHVTLEREVLRSCEHLDLPVPNFVEVSKSPLVRGAENVAVARRLRHRGEQVTASFHARIRFDQPVAGPIVLGSLRRYGFGLMLPHASSHAQIEPDQDARSAATGEAGG